MRVLISADMEGTCGVVNWVQVIPPEIAGPGRQTSTVEYERARKRMTREVNAAIEGALDAGADSVLVNDSHDGMRNLLPDEIHPGATFVSGSDKPLSMVQGVDESDIGALIYTGYHARAGTPDGPLAHSFTGWVHDIRVNGESVGEYGINALIAGHFGVPVAMVAGDLRAVEQTRDYLGEQVVGVSVKTGYSVSAAINIHPTKAEDLIRDGARQAIQQLDSMTPKTLEQDSVIEIDLDHQTRVDQVMKLPDVERIGWRTFAIRPNDGAELARQMRAVLGLAGARPS